MHQPNPLVSQKRLLLFALALSVLAWGEPAEAKQCAREEVNRVRQLAHALAKCAGDPNCETAARDRCFEHLSRAGCNVSVCGSGGLLGSTGEQCAFNTAESASKALNTLLTNQVLPELNADWPTTATTPPPDPTGLDPYTLPSQESTVSGGCSDDGGDVACAAVTGSCSKVVAKFTPTIHGLSQLQFQSLAVKSLTTQDLSSFSSGGPDASRIHAYGAFPSDGGAWNSASAVVLPVTGVVSAITTDLGQVFTLCADGATCPAVMFQGSGNAAYRIDYSVDGKHWTTWLDVPTSCATCNSTLRTRQVTVANTIQARYLRTYAVSTNGTGTQLSVSRVEFWALGSSGPQLISQLRPARGPQPKITTPPFPTPTVAAYNDPLATVLPNEGPASAVTLDLGRVVYTRTDGSVPGLPVQLMTSGNDEYRLEYSTDGITWVLWKEVPQVCGCSEIEMYFVTAPNVAGRYFRIYHPSGTPGDGKYSVAQFFIPYTLTPDGTQVLVAQNVRTFGPEALATNGEFAPAGTAWNDSRYATVIAGAGKQYGLIIDLGEAAGRGITRVKIQADQNDTYVVAISQDALNWSILYTANPVPNTNGLQIRDSGDTLRDPSTGKPWVGRYIWVYPSSGDGKYSVSEVQIFNDSLAAGCPFDANANAIALGSAKCSYSGDITADAAMPSGTPFSIHLSDLSVFAKCDTLFGNVDVPLYPPFSGTTSGNCTVSPFGLEADVNFCAVTCDTSSGATEPVEITYQQVASVVESAGSGSPLCDLDDSAGPFPSDTFETDVTTAINAALRPLVASAVRDVQNALLRELSPFPGETLASGAPAVCTSP